MTVDWISLCRWSHNDARPRENSRAYTTTTCMAVKANQPWDISHAYVCLHYKFPKNYKVPSLCGFWRIQGLHACRMMNTRLIILHGLDSLFSKTNFFRESEMGPTFIIHEGIEHRHFTILVGLHVGARLKSIIQIGSKLQRGMGNRVSEDAERA